MPDTSDPACWRMVLPHTAAAVPMARAIVRAALAEIESAADCHTAELLTAELVANAVEHTPGGSPIELVVKLLPTGCHVEVHDAAPAPPGDLSPAAPAHEASAHEATAYEASSHEARHPDLWQEHGRGLVLIRALSSACGHRPTASGKAVWFTLPARS